MSKTAAAESRHLTGIEWTHWPGRVGDVLNDVVGCDKESAGCKFCWSKTLHDRRHRAFMDGKPVPPQYAEPFETVQLLPERFEKALRRRKRTVFFSPSTSDPFHPDVTDEHLNAKFAVMRLTPWHVYLMLTKRGERMREFTCKGYSGMVDLKIEGEPLHWAVNEIHTDAIRHGDRKSLLVRLLPKAIDWEAKYGDLHGVPPDDYIDEGLFGSRYPFPNVCMGVSVESRGQLSRLDALRDVPNALPWVSLEPLLEEVDIRPYLDFLKWVVVGGETGGRPCNVAWIRRVVRDCRAAGVPVFVKQLGSSPFDAGECDRLSYGWGKDHAVCDCGDFKHGDSFYRLRSVTRKGGDPSEWPEDLRVREFPALAYAA